MHRDYAVGALSGRWTSVLTLKPLMYLGRISYTVYLIHVTWSVPGEEDGS
jgi:peptidoglycan/LPS O-acetylase OafA/YrhL